MCADNICFLFEFNGIRCSIKKVKKNRYKIYYGYFMERYHYFMFSDQNSYACKQDIVDIVYLYIMKSGIIDKLETVYDKDDTRLLGEVLFSIKYNSCYFDFECPYYLIKDSCLFGDFQNFHKIYIFCFSFYQKKKTNGETHHLF